MKSTDMLLLGAVGLMAFIFISKAKAASTLIFLPGGINSISFENATPVVDLSLIVQNTSSSGFTLESMAGNLYCDGTYIGNLSSFIPIDIAGNSESIVNVRARLQLIGIINEIIAAITNKNISKTIQLRGNANAGFVRAPIDVAFKIGAGT
jgi:LEA14-like dessication related protein